MGLLLSVPVVSRLCPLACLCFPHMCTSASSLGGWDCMQHIMAAQCFHTLASVLGCRSALILPCHAPAFRCRPGEHPHTPV